MSLKLLDSENADRDLAAGATVLTHTPSATAAKLCQAHIALGDGVKDLDGTGGAFEVTITIGGQTWNGGAEVHVLGTAVRSAIQTTAFPVPANAEVVIAITSPNAGDSDVDTTAYLYELAGAVDGVADAVWDEARSGHVTAGTFGEVLQSSYTAQINLTHDSEITPNGRDYYCVRWFENGIPLTTGITVPLLYVYDGTDGSTLINGEALVDAGSGQLVWPENTNLQTHGTPYVAKVTATIDGATRTWRAPVFRDR